MFASKFVCRQSSRPTFSSTCSVAARIKQKLGRDMKKLAIPLLLIVCALATTALADQPSAKIIDRYKKASGGKAASRVKSTVITGTIKNSDGAKGLFSYQAFAPNNLRVDIDLGGVKVSECYNGKSAWRLDARGLRTLLGDDAKRLRLES